MTDYHGAGLEPGFERWRAPELVPLPPRQPGERAPLRVLPPGVAARIAAGETIENPASVVKELIENGLDAGARTIRVDLRGGGLGLIRVGDDGEGIRPADLWLACQRHATSKFPTEGLERIVTLGFRGEALPSIAAVAELAIVSAVDDSGAGWTFALGDNQVVTDQPAPRTRGTTVSVRRLFERLPGRLAAMQPRAELTRAGQTVRRLAAAAPNVRFQMHVDDRLALQTSGSGDLATTIAELYGLDLIHVLSPLGPIEIGGVRVHGVIAVDGHTRAGRTAIHLSVNGRAARASLLQTLVETAYRPVLPRGRHPVLALVLTCPPERVDVNIHPAKEMVRPRDERAIGEACAAMVREALGKRPFTLLPPLATGAAALEQHATRRLAEDGPDADENAPIVTAALPPLRLLGQVQGRLLLLEGDAGLYFVDQHRAHERVLYEQLRAAHATNRPRDLAEPIVIELRPHHAARVAARLPELAALGFGLESFGGRSFLLRAAPDLAGVLPGNAGALEGLADPDDLPRALVALADDEPGDGEDWQERLLVSLSCRCAVRRGVPLSHPAMRALVERLGATSLPAVCPHGSPLLMQVNGSLFARQFGWS